MIENHVLIIIKTTTNYKKYQNSDLKIKLEKRNSLDLKFIIENVRICKSYAIFFILSKLAITGDGVDKIIP